MIKTRKSFRWLTCFVMACLLLPATACKQKKETPPVPEATMEAILLDLHLAEAYSQGLGDSARNRFEKNYDTLGDFYISVFKHHKLNLEQFDEALEWYKERPGLIDSLYVKVLSRLSEVKASKGIKDLDGTPPAEAATVVAPANIDAITKTDSATARRKDLNKKKIKPLPPGGEP